MTQRCALLFAAVSCVLGCSPNLVVGMREPDAAVLQPDSGRVDASQPTAAVDGGGVQSDAAPAPPDPDASMNVEMQNDGGTSCTTDEQCTDSDEPLCNVSEGRCVECSSDAQCDPNEVCEEDGECSARPIPCTSALQCAGSGDPVCHPTLQICVECVTDDQCPRNEACTSDNECD